MHSIKKHWNDALFNVYNRINIDDTNKLVKHLIMDVQDTIVMIDEQGVTDIKKLLKTLNQLGHVKIILFNSIPEVHHASTLIGKNVKGYENSFIYKGNLLKMLLHVEDGKTWLFKDLTHYIINKFIQNTSESEPDFISLLTQKEKTIAQMIANGLSNKEICQAEKLALSTVKGHIQKIFKKANVSDRISLALKFK